MTAAEYLASEPVGNADLLEMLRRGTADVLYCTQHALAMHERVSGAAVLCAETEREARAALEHLPHTGLYVAHGALCARLLREETGCTGDKSAVRHGICGLCRPRPCRAWNCAFWMKAIQTLCLNTITWRRAEIM